MTDATVIHTPTCNVGSEPISCTERDPAPNLEALYTKHGYEAIAELHPAYYCTTCATCVVQHKANELWQTKNSALLAKEQEAYNEECWRLEEEEQERREHFEWTHRNWRW